MSERHSRISLWFERIVLGAAMSLVAFVTERILLRALKRGGVRAAARTAAGHGPGEDGDAVDDVGRSWEVRSGAGGLTTTPKDVAQQEDRQ